MGAIYKRRLHERPLRESLGLFPSPKSISLPLHGGSYCLVSCSRDVPTPQPPRLPLRPRLAVADGVGSSKPARPPWHSSAGFCPSAAAPPPRLPVPAWGAVHHLAFQGLAGRSTVPPFHCLSKKPLTAPPLWLTLILVCVLGLSARRLARVRCRFGPGEPRVRRV